MYIYKLFELIGSVSVRQWSTRIHEDREREQEKRYVFFLHARSDEVRVRSLVGELRWFISLTIRNRSISLQSYKRKRKGEIIHTNGIDFTGLYRQLLPNYFFIFTLVMRYCSLQTIFLVKHLFLYIFL